MVQSEHLAYNNSLLGYPHLVAFVPKHAKWLLQLDTVSLLQAGRKRMGERGSGVIEHNFFFFLFDKEHSPYGLAATYHPGLIHGHLLLHRHLGRWICLSLRPFSRGRQRKREFTVHCLSITAKAIVAGDISVFWKLLPLAPLYGNRAHMLKVSW